MLRTCYSEPTHAPFEVVWLAVQACGLADQPGQLLELLRAVLVVPSSPSWLSPERAMQLLRLATLTTLGIDECDSLAVHNLRLRLEASVAQCVGSKRPRDEGDAAFLAASEMLSPQSVRRNLVTRISCQRCHLLTDISISSQEKTCLARRG